MDSRGTTTYRALTLALAGVFLLTACDRQQASPDQEPPADALAVPTAQFRERATTLGATTYHYTVYLPARWGARETWPLIVALHNLHGQRKNRPPARNELETVLGEGNAAPLALVLFPHCPLDHYWSEPEIQDLVLVEIKHTVQEFRGDAQRVYLTGHGLGGYGTWMLAAAHPDVFAALVPIAAGIRLPNGIPCPPRRCGPGSGSDPYSIIAQKIQGIPVWFFHGADDRLIPVFEARQMYETLKSLGGNVRYTEYAGVGHHCWRRVYRDPELWSWLLAQHRGQ